MYNQSLHPTGYAGGRLSALGGTGQMRIYTPIWKDPVGWAEKAAKSKLRVIVWILIHTLVIAGSLACIYSLLRRLHADSEAWVSFIHLGAGPIIVVGIILPANYLYVQFRLLKLLSEQKIPDDVST